jgi:hypothetical protein
MRLGISAINPSNETAWKETSGRFSFALGVALGVGYGTWSGNKQQPPKTGEKPDGEA